MAEGAAYFENDCEMKSADETDCSVSSNKHRRYKPIPKPLVRPTLVQDEKMHSGITNNQKLAALRKEEGNKMYSAKEYQTALKLYSEAIQLDSTCAPYYGNRCACYMMLKDYNNALADAKTSTTLNKVFVKGYHREAKCHIALGAPSTAMQCLEKARDLEPSNKQVEHDIAIARSMIDFETQAKFSESRGDYRKTEYCLRRLTEYAPDCLAFKALHSETLALTGKYEDAQCVANDVLRTQPQNSEALYVRGLCFYYQDQTEKAYRVFQQLLRMAPDFEKAKDIYKKARSLETTKEAGNNAFRSGKLSQAYELYTRALGIDPLNKITNAKLHSNRATVTYKQGNFKGSIDDCTRAMELDPKFIKPYLRRAKCFMDTEQYDEAVREYEKICKMERNNEYRHMLRDAKLELKKSKRKDYYKILNVSKTATDEEIKKAYKKEALNHHPDRHSHTTEEVKKEEEKKFKEVGEAYSVLSDKRKRMRYDSGQDIEDGGIDMGDFDPNQIFQAFFQGPGGFSFASSSSGHPGGGFPGGFQFSFG